MQCSNCKSNNKYTDKYCQTCGKELLNLKAKENRQRYSKKILIFFLLFFILPIIIPLFLFGIEMYKTSLKISNEAEKIKETKGTLDGYVNCDYEYQLNKCNGLYKYNVNGKEYKIEGTEREEMDSLEKEITVYYNFENPSEASIYKSIFANQLNTFKTIFLVISIAIFIVTIIPIVIIFKILTGSKEKNKKIDGMDNKTIKL